MADFDPQAFDDVGNAVPTVTPSLQTFYYPETDDNTRAAGLDPKMEGGIHGSGDFSEVDLRNHTLEKFMSGESPFVAVAMKGEPDGREFSMNVNGANVLAKNVDTGGGLKDGQIDVATANPDLAKGGGGFNPNAFGPSVEHGVGNPRNIDPRAFLEPVPAEPEAAQQQKEKPDLSIPPITPISIPQVSINVPQFSNREIVGSPMQGVRIGPIPTGPPPPIGPSPPPQPPSPFERFVSTPLVSPQQMLPAVKAAELMDQHFATMMDGLRRLSPDVAAGVEQSAAEQMSGLTAPANAAMMPSMMIPGVPEAYAGYQALQTPKVWSGINDVINRYGLGSKESVAALTNEAVRMSSAVIAPIAGRVVRGVANVGKPPVEPPTGSTAQLPFPPEGEPTGISPLQVMSRHEIADRIVSQGPQGARDTMASLEARQQSNLLRNDFAKQYPNQKFDALMKEGSPLNKDLEAATFIEEAGRNPVALKKDAQLVKTSKNVKLREKYGPVMDYAIASFDRLSKLPQRYGDLMREQMAQDAAAGINYGQRQRYVTHVLKNEPDNSLMSFFTSGKSGGAGLTRYFTKHRDFNTLAEAIHDGFDPRSVNLADLAEKRIADSQKLILEKALFQEMRATAGPDGRPAIASAGDTPRGYDIVDAGGTQIASHPDYTGLWKALYGDSALRRSATGRAFMKAVGIEKSYTLALDTFHGMVGLMKGAAYGGKGMRFGYTKGLSLFEYPDEMLGDLVKRGDLTKADAKAVKDARTVVMAPLRNGLNVGRYADNLVDQLHATFPGTKGVNDWIFKKVFRGAMIQAAYANMVRNMDRFPELGIDGNGRRTAKEMNEVFGNLQNQSIIKDKTLRDASNILILAPQWAESQIAAEGRGYGQFAKIPYDAISNGKLRMGTVAQGQATLALAYLVGNQIINYATTGHSTFQNPEGHKLAAYLPIGRGLYMDPFSMAAPLVDRLSQITSRQGEKANVGSVLSEFGRSKLSRIAQAAATFFTQTDPLKRPLRTNQEVVTGTLGQLVPLPIAASTFVQPDARSPIGFKGQIPQMDQFVKQMLQGLGQRATIDYNGPVPAAQSPTNTMRANVMRPQIMKANVMRPRVMR